VTSAPIVAGYLSNLPAYRTGVSPLLRGVEIGLAHGFFLVRRTRPGPAAAPRCVFTCSAAARLPTHPAWRRRSAGPQRSPAASARPRRRSWVACQAAALGGALCRPARSAPACTHLAPARKRAPADSRVRGSRARSSSWARCAMWRRPRRRLAAWRARAWSLSWRSRSPRTAPRSSSRTRRRWASRRCRAARSRATRCRCRPCAPRICTRLPAGRHARCCSAVRHPCSCCAARALWVSGAGCALGCCPEAAVFACVHAAAAAGQSGRGKAAPTIVVHIPWKRVGLQKHDNAYEPAALDLRPCWPAWRDTMLKRRAARAVLGRLPAVCGRVDRRRPGRRRLVLHSDADAAVLLLSALCHSSSGAGGGARAGAALMQTRPHCFWSRALALS
jgi:hypothetical protein